MKKHTKKEMREKIEALIPPFAARLKRYALMIPCNGGWSTLNGL